MQTYTEKLKAGKMVPLPTSGRVFLIDSVSPAGASVDVTILQRGAAAALLPGRKTGFKVITDFDGLQFTSAVDATVTFIVSNDDVQVGFADGASVSVPGGVAITNTAATPVPVSFSGTVEPVLGNVKVTNADADAVPVAQKAGAVFTVAPAAGAALDVTVKNTDDTAVPTRNQSLLNILEYVVNMPTANTKAQLRSDPTNRKIRFRNTHATAMVALGSTNVTLANATILLGPGDVHFEDDAAGATWYGISDTANVQVNMQVLK
ncbi:hypothetical protein GWL_18250 [Herbaspirillum sp. GW103]|uniref:hypothetical protein n=1 Tax=Herbaspirillum sp. GW103 TaxID=1175306 RepID=UPI00025E2EBF|nr:hypothetical protein [Herbaspirillum sp. GW103]EIJ47584.1 hypothetical protein GWL_18250 [Herbaspirillum sp. GW103]